MPLPLSDMRSIDRRSDSRQHVSGYGLVVSEIHLAVNSDRKSSVSPCSRLSTALVKQPLISDSNNPVVCSLGLSRRSVPMKCNEGKSCDPTCGLRVTRQLSRNGFAPNPRYPPEGGGHRNH